jgi:RNA polymerase sigma-70 factor (ECF subfamily)
METSASTAARVLFDEHGGAVYRFALMLLRHPHDAEDVVQETFLKLMHHLSTRGNTDNLRGWLFTVAAHAARDRQRGRRRWIPWASMPEPSIDPPPLPDEDGRLRASRQAMQRLAPRDRMLLALRASGLSYRDVAAAARIRPASVGRLLARAIDRWGTASTGAMEFRGVAGRDRAGKGAVL